MACVFVFMQLLCSMAAGVLAADGQAFVGLNGNGTNLVLDPPAGGQVVVDGHVFQELVQRVSQLGEARTEMEQTCAAQQAELSVLRAQVEDVSNSLSRAHRELEQLVNTTCRLDCQPAPTTTLPTTLSTSTELPTFPSWTGAGTLVRPSGVERFYSLMQNSTGTLFAGSGGNSDPYAVYGWPSGATTASVTLPNPTNNVEALLEVNHLLFVGDANFNIFAWNLSTAAPNLLFQLSVGGAGEVDNLVVHNGELFAVCTQEILIWNITVLVQTKAIPSTPAARISIQSTQNVAVALWADGNILFCTKTEQILAIDTQTRQVRHTLSQMDQSFVRGMALSPKRQLLFSGGYDQALRVWSLNPYTYTPLPGQAVHLQSVSTPANIRAMSLLEEQGVLAVALSSGDVQVWDIRSLPLQAPSQTLRAGSSNNAVLVTSEAIFSAGDEGLVHVFTRQA